MHARFCNTCRRLCSKCGVGQRAIRSRYCSDCKNAYARATRPKYWDLSEEEKKRARCRSYARYYLKTGLIEKKPCSVDGCTLPSQMHHPDYDRPLKIVWLCRKHHVRLHQDAGSWRKKAE